MAISTGCQPAAAITAKNQTYQIETAANVLPTRDPRCAIQVKEYQMRLVTEFSDHFHERSGRSYVR